MEKLLHLVCLLLSLPIISAFSSPHREKKSYIVYFGEHSGEKTFQEIEDTHHSYLLSVQQREEEAKASLLYSYKNVINGFAAMLSPNEASKLSQKEEVVSVFRSRQLGPHTTRSWEFAGLHQRKRLTRLPAESEGGDLLLRARYGEDVIVGLLDSGVWPESESFRDEGMGPVPKSWKGICQSGDAFNSSHCNRKIIGARYYLKAYEARFGPLNTTIDCRSARDVDGHGTHTASTVGGRRVPHASAIGGFAKGTASGGAPLVRLAIYKVCWTMPRHSKVDENTCFEEDMLAALDDAIADGVHVLSLSIGTGEPVPYDEDGIAIGSLHAQKRNIVVSTSAGNTGPAQSTLSNPAPWVITVGASSLDRSFPSPIMLGNGILIPGQTITYYKLEKKMYPLVYAGNVVADDVPKTYIAGQCLPGSLSPEKTEGKIVLCLRGNGTRAGKGMEAKRARAAGFILGNSPPNGNEITVDAHVLPATAVVSDDSIRTLAYINSTQNPTATIIPAKTLLHTKPAPFMAAFTSRGPNVVDPYILKPDITAPGLNILAAWSKASSPTKLEDDHRIAKYHIMSGTSMSCPHVAAAAALLKAIHPKWSSAAIRSALMTTATLTNNVGLPLADASGNLADPFQYGAGHFQPAKAADPGLVYDASYVDYLLHLCHGGVIKTIDPSFKCPEKAPASGDLNYPSVSIPKLNGTAVVRRTVTNVGGGKSVYLVSVRPPTGFSVEVSPSILFFHRVGLKRSFTIRVKANGDPNVGRKEGHGYAFGSYTWSDGLHIVRSTIAVSTA